MLDLGNCTYRHILVFSVKIITSDALWRMLVLRLFVTIAHYKLDTPAELWK